MTTINDKITKVTSLDVYGAKEHNLKNIDISIPLNKLVVLTGLSGSGKSSLAFDTIFLEGQRRYLETLSSYARQFIGTYERPDVEKIDGLSPVIAIEQKTTSKNPRSTVGTITEIYDFLRLLYARVADAYSYVTGEKMIKYSEEKIINLIKQEFLDKEILILAPVVKGRKGNYKELFQHILKKGYLRARVNGEIMSLSNEIKLDRYKTHDIEIVIDKITIKEDNFNRLNESINIALKEGEGVLMIFNEILNKQQFFSKNLMCPTSGIAYDDPAPNMFSFNSPYGTCPKCKGLGYISVFDEELIIPDKNLSIKDGGIVPLGVYTNNWIFTEIEKICKSFDFTIKTPIKDIPQEGLDGILYGINSLVKHKDESLGITVSHNINFEGIISFLSNYYAEELPETTKRWIKRYMNKSVCPECNGSRLRKEAQYFKIDNKNISELSNIGMIELQQWFENIEERLSEKQNLIAIDVLKEIRSRLELCNNLGIGYLSLNRPARTLSGGEAQRIRLATQIGSQLVNVLYILDEPSIGLHQRDNTQMINALKELRDSGNSIIVVEHDKEIMLESDYIIDMGPFAGRFGGEITDKGTPDEIIKKGKSLTAQYLRGDKKIKTPEERRQGNGNFIKLINARGNNLKNVNLTIPLGKFICITGISGSGKTTLINNTLYPIISQELYNSIQQPLEYDSIEGIKEVDKIIVIDQSPIGRTPRSNPSTYTGVFTDIRELFAQMPEAKIRGYKAGRFSFNVKGGRCETCKGAGIKTIEMNFLPDVNVKCETCNGKRYNDETLEVKYKGKSISDVLNMTINQAVEFFNNIPSILLKIRTLQEVGLGYITLGQQSTTLSGGEAQRVKLATELSKKDTGQTLYILDEPTTGLHFEDINVLLKVLNKLVDKNNTIIVIEHNLDIIKCADHIIDLGPEGGFKGGEIIAEGTPEEIIKNKKSFTAHYLKKELLECKLLEQS